MFLFKFSPCVSAFFNIPEIIEKMRKIMQINQMIHINEVLGMIKYTKDMVYKTIEFIIEKKILFKDRLGFEKYLYYNNGHLFLNSTYSKNFNSVSFYIGRYSHIPNNPSCSLDLFMKINREEKIKNLINNGNFEINMSKDEISEVIEKIIVENIEKIKNNVTLNIDNFISLFPNKHKELLNNYKQFIYLFNKPVSKIEKIIDHKINKAKGRGRKPLNKERKDFKKVNLNNALKKGITHEETNGDGQFVILHNIKKNVFRTINLTVSVWQNAINEQITVYDQMIQYRNIFKLKRYEKYLVYGTILEDKKFRIRNKLNENKQNVTIDSRTVHTGRVAKNLPKKTLVEIIFHLNILPEKMYNKISYNTKKEILLKKKIISRFDCVDESESFEKKVNFMYAWHKAPIDKMCDSIKSYFINNDMMFVF